MSRWIWLCAAVALSTAGCRSGGGPQTQDDASSMAARMDRSDWMVSQATRVSKVMEFRTNQPPRHVGYMVATDYRQMRGGPVFKMYKITTLDRSEQIGHIDQVGRGTRYEPRRNGGFEEVDLGVGERAQQVAAIFGFTRAVSFEPTTERRLAFEAIDLNRDGALSREEMAEYGDRVRGADRNKDGTVDFEEFDLIDVL